MRISETFSEVVRIILAGWSTACKAYAYVLHHVRSGTGTVQSQVIPNTYEYYNIL